MISQIGGDDHKSLKHVINLSNFERGKSSFDSSLLSCGRFEVGVSDHRKRKASDGKAEPYER
jgi:hypothetical protein